MKPRHRKPRRLHDLVVPIAYRSLMHEYDMFTATAQTMYARCVRCGETFQVTKNGPGAEMPAQFLTQHAQYCVPKPTISFTSSWESKSA